MQRTGDLTQERNRESGQAKGQRRRANAASIRNLKRLVLGLTDSRFLSCVKSPVRCIGSYRPRANTSVMSSGCSLGADPVVDRAVTISLMPWQRQVAGFSIPDRFRRCSPNSPKSFSGSVTPSL